MSNYKEGKKSTFTHLGKTRKVDDLIEAVKENPIEIFQTSIFSWLIEYYDNEAQRTGLADFDHPIIITRDLIDANDRYIILDGFHRYIKALSQGKKFIKVKEISKKDLNKIRII